MPLRERLSERIHQSDILAICREMDDDSSKQELWMLMFDEDKRTSDNAAWIFSHFSQTQRRWLEDKQEALIDEALRTTSTTKQRIILALIERQGIGADEIRTDFLDFCIQKFSSPFEPTGIRSLCMKLAYWQCRNIQELRGELKATLEIMPLEEMKPGLRHARNKILQTLAQKA